MAFMHIPECGNRSLYVGSTIDLDRRPGEHEEGLGSNHTKCRLPVRLWYREEFDRIEDALGREKQVQGWSRAKRLALVKGVGRQAAGAEQEAELGRGRRCFT
jgi:putative endonuclease